MKFDENLRNLRREKDYSQEYLAGVMDVSRQTISKWENGTAMPDLKKLTQLAELFEISMDTLLGIEYSAKEDNGSDNTDAQNENNFDSIAALIEADHKAILTSTKKILAVTFSVIIIVAVIISSLVVSDLKDNINFIRNQVQSLFENQQYYSDSGSSDYNEMYYTECEITGIDKQKPYIVNARFTYEPTTYAKGTSVYFLIPQKDGEFKHIDADPDKAEQGLFTAECQLDVTLNRCFYTIIDDGESITKEEVSYDTLNVYPEFEDYGAGDYVMSMNGSPSSMIISAGEAQWVYANYGGDIKSARQIVKLNGKDLHNSEIKISKSQTGIAFNLNVNKEIALEVPAGTTNVTPNKFEFYYEFEMDMGYTVRFHPSLLDSTDNTYIFDFEEAFGYYEYIFDIDGEKVTVRE